MCSAFNSSGHYKAYLRDEMYVILNKKKHIESNRTSETAQKMTSFDLEQKNGGNSMMNR
jgi:hypothetical protein